MLPYRPTGCCVLTKSELLGLFDAAGRCHRSWARERISRHILGGYSDQRIRQIASGHVTWFTLIAPWHWQLVQLLYFGQSDKNWSTQIRRDLGQVRYETVELSSLDLPVRRVFRPTFASENCKAILSVGRASLTTPGVSR